MRKSYQSDWLLLLLFTPLPVTLFLVVSISRPALHCWKKWIQYKNTTIMTYKNVRIKTIQAGYIKKFDFSVEGSVIEWKEKKLPVGIEFF